MKEISNENTFNSLDKKYLQLLEEARKKVLSTRIQLAKAASKSQFDLYCWFGERIVVAQINYGWGKAVVEQLSKDLRQLFSGTTHGFSDRNLWNMRKFYLEYKGLPNLQQLVAEIPWGQNLVILNKIKEQAARRYYIEMTIRFSITDSRTGAVNPKVYLHNKRATSPS